ncbi:MAG: diguanylate cyclase, partial [Gammaproteobacteria bacterium]
IAEQIRISIEELRLPHNASRIKDIVTASFGVTTIVPKQDQTPNILVKQADIALYKAKSIGRNKVVRFKTENNIISLKGT